MDQRDLAPGENAAIAKISLATGQFAWHAVSTKVNNTRNDGAELIDSALEHHCLHRVAPIA